MQSIDSSEPISPGLEPLDSNGLNIIVVTMSVLLMSVGAFGYERRRRREKTAFHFESLQESNVRSINRRIKGNYNR